LDDAEEMLDSAPGYPNSSGCVYLAARRERRPEAALAGLVMTRQTIPRARARVVFVNGVAGIAETPPASLSRPQQIGAIR